MVKGFYLRFGEGIDEAANKRALGLMRALLEEPHPAITDLIPGYASLYVEYDARLAREGEIRAYLAGKEPRYEESPREVEIPVRYDGPDLSDLADWAGISEEEVVRRHAGRTYRVYAVGFLPGFPFLAPVDEKIARPRLPRPRREVYPHAVGVAGRQTGIYPLKSPGGWNLIGRALVAVYDPARKKPFLLAPGDRVRFVEAEGEPPPEPEGISLLETEPEKPVLRVLEEGLVDLVVDSGRRMGGRFGLAKSGPLDPLSFAVANRLLANPPDAPALEVSLKGPRLEVLADAVFAYAGFGLVPRLDGEEVPPFTSFLAKKGQVLDFLPKGHGARGYLAVMGGLAAREFWGSRSVDLRAKVGRPLRAGDVLGRGEGAARPGFSYRPFRAPSREVRLRLLPGPQANREALFALCRGSFEVSAADRVGVRLSGPPVPGGEVTSEAVPLGAVQVPPAGEPIILLADRGTLGGYQKPAVVDPRDLPLLGQVVVGDRVRFVLDSCP